ncbi:MAG: esterase [Myxococcaceae bacterium]|nr:esterase [Myxococcaceae bacterium]
MRLAARSGLLLWLLLSVSGCAFLRAASNPMERRSFRERGAARARGAIVLLPGFGDRPEAFAEHGFVAALERQAQDYDVFAADAHFGYYRKRSLLVRLEHDVIGPLRARGYREIWLAAASLGGFGAVAYARTHPSGIRGVLLFAPYLGPKEVVTKVAAVGLCHYDEQPSATDDQANFARKNFLWLKQQACVDRKVSLWLGVGSDDRLRRPDGVLGDALPASHVLILPGGHGWKVWTPAVEQLAKTAFDTSENLH